MTSQLREKAKRILGAALIGDRAQLAHLVREVNHIKRCDTPPDPALKSHPGMRFARVLVPVFANTSPAHVEFSRQALQAGVYGLMLQNIAWLRTHPNTPPLYHSGVIYKPEKHRVDHGGHTIEYGEDWQTIPWVIHHGYGDCEDLGAWRAAELQMHGVPAVPHIAIRRLADDGGKAVWRAHVQVRLPDGRIEDPSAKLGMYAYSGLY